MKNKAGTFCTVFPNYRDYHFYKDPGQLPYRFASLGYNASIICYQSDDALTETRRHLDVVRVPGNAINRRINSGIIMYLLFNAKRIDILNVFHYSWSSLLFAFIYKTVNKKGFVYLKFDHCAYARRGPDSNNSVRGYLPDMDCETLKGRIKNYFAGRFFVVKVDLWSVEDYLSREMLESEADFLKGKLITVYNGQTSDLPGSLPACNPDMKEDIILTAGRLGTYQKATEVLMEAFKRVSFQTHFNLHLAGPIDPLFRDYLDKYIRENPSLGTRVIIHGPLGRDELYRLYCRSAIFCMPSRYEGMAIVFPEAMYYGNVIVTTADTSLKPLVEDRRFGLVVKRENTEALADALLKLTGDRQLIREMAHNARMTATDELSWDTIVKELHSEIEARRADRELR